MIWIKLTSEDDDDELMDGRELHPAEFGDNIRLSRKPHTNRQIRQTNSHVLGELAQLFFYFSIVCRCRFVVATSYRVYVKMFYTKIALSSRRCEWENFWSSQCVVQ